MKRRRAHEGSVRLRADGRWEGRIRYIDPLTHLPKRASFFGGTEGAVVKKLRAAAERIERHATPQDDTSRLDAFLEHWTTVMGPTWKPSTRRSYVAAVNGLPLALAKLRLRELTPGTLARLIAGMPTTRTSALQIAVVRSALADATEWGLLAVNPAKRLASPRVRHREFRTFSVDEVRRFFEALDPAELPLYRLALETGMRQGELLALERADLDLSAGVIHIRRSPDKTARTVDTPKTRAARRSLPLGPVVCDLLAAHLEHNPGRLLFPSQSGGYIHASNLLRRSFYPALERAGLPKIRFHDLRHTAATLWLQAGLHPKAVSERLGHAGIEITLRVYGHALPPAHAATAGFLEVALGVESGVKAFPVKQ